VATYSVSGVGPTFFARNGGGDPYFTDGEIEVSKLVSGCSTEGGTPQALPPPPTIIAKNAVFSRLTSFWRALRERRYSANTTVLP
jgi:hypothetical protein